MENGGIINEKIDLTAINQKRRKIAFFEVKWWEFDNSKGINRVPKELKRKSESIDWFNEERCEYFGFIAREIDKDIRMK